MNPFLFLSALIQLAAVGLAIWLGVSLASEDYFSVALIVLPIAAVAALLKPRWVFGFMIAAFVSGLTLPSLPFKLNLFNVLSGIVIVQALIAVALQRPNLWRIPRLYAWLAGFLGVTVLTMLVRGSGLKAFGSSSWGGFVYFQLFFAVALAFAMPRLAPGLSPAGWRRALLFLGVLSLLPPVSDLVTLATGRLDMWNFVQGSGGIGAMYATQETGIGTMRFQGAGLAGFYLFFSFLVWSGTRRMFSLPRIPFLLLPALCLVLILFSGFRNLLVQFSILLGSLMWLQRAWTPKNLLLIASLLVALLAGVATFSNQLPDAAQRALSFLPGVHVSSVVAKEAQDSIDWRLELWQRAWETAPQYWKIGRGVAFTGHDLQVANDPNLRPDSIEWALVTGTYHSGVLSLLLTFGAAGLICSTCLFVGACIRHVRRARGTWHDPVLQGCHQAATAWMVTQVVTFYLIYGDIQGSIPSFLFLLAVLETLVAADVPQEAIEEEKMAEPSLPLA